MQCNAVQCSLLGVLAASEISQGTLRTPAKQPLLDQPNAGYGTHTTAVVLYNLCTVILENNNGLKMVQTSDNTFPGQMAQWQSRADTDFYLFSIKL